ncbi:hypothetical protein [Asticcacaulis solisilvae]|uniref:hypothetical protein n=1 Tax=Asticcacaulis solisilvae TaxID=1217274 RepID=UPI003FD82090
MLISTNMGAAGAKRSGVPTSLCTGNTKQSACHCFTQAEMDKFSARNDIFSRIRGAFALSTEQDGSAFHFVVIDGRHSCITSLGFQPERAGAPEAQEHRKPVMPLSERKAAEGDVIGILEDCLEANPDLDKVAAWARYYLANREQPLSASPSRLEQALAVTMARRGNVITLTRDDRDYAREKGLIVLDNYLSDLPRWGALWRRAISVLGGVPDDVARNSAAPVDAETLPFLLAEFMQFRRPGEPRKDFMARMRTSPPGIAFLPIRILGQYRAAAAWFYCGAYNDNKELSEHVGHHLAYGGDGRMDWLAETVESAVLDNATFDLLAAVHYFEAPAGCTMKSCRNLWEALKGFWCSRSIALENGRQTTNSAETELPGLLSRLPTEVVTIDLHHEPDVVDLLGFERMHFRCPLMDPHYVAEAKRDVEGMIRAVIHPAAKRLAMTIRVRAERDRREAEQDRQEAEGRLVKEAAARKQASEAAARETLTKIGVTGHDFANSLKDLMALSSIDDVDPEAAYVRLVMVNNRARQLECHASLLRSIVRDEGKAVDANWSDPDTHPVEEDRLFWRDYVHSVTLCTVFAERWILLGSRRNEARSIALNYSLRFEGPGGETLEHRPGTTMITADSAVLASFPELTTRDVPPWPIRRLIRGERDRLSENGKLMTLMWGPFELLRNAGRASAALLCDLEQTTRDIDMHFSIGREGGRWCFRAAVDNDIQDWASAGEPHDIASLRRVMDCVPDSIFRREVVSRRRVRYSYQGFLS